MLGAEVIFGKKIEITLDVSFLASGLLTFSNYIALVDESCHKSVCTSIHGHPIHTSETIFYVESRSFGFVVVCREVMSLVWIAAYAVWHEEGGE